MTGASSNGGHLRPGSVGLHSGLAGLFCPGPPPSSLTRLPDHVDAYRTGALSHRLVQQHEVQVDQIDWSYTCRYLQQFAAMVQEMQQVVLRCPVPLLDLLGNLLASGLASAIGVDARPLARLVGCATACKRFASSMRLTLWRL